MLKKSIKLGSSKHRTACFRAAEYAWPRARPSGFAPFEICVDNLGSVYYDCFQFISRIFSCFFEFLLFPFSIISIVLHRGGTELIGD